MRVGEVYIVKPECAIPTKTNENPPMKGTVIWVHPKERFAVLEFEGVSGNPRKCFQARLLTEANRIKPRRRNGK